MIQNFLGIILLLFLFFLVIAWLGSSLHFNSRKGGARLIERGRGFIRVIHIYDKTKIEGSIYGSPKVVDINLEGMERDNLLSNLKDKLPFFIDLGSSSIEAEVIFGYYQIVIKNEERSVDLWLNYEDLVWLKRTLESN